MEYCRNQEGNGLSEKRRGWHFFSDCVAEMAENIFADDRENFRRAMTRRTLMKALGVKDTFIMTYRQMNGDRPVYMNMKVTRLQGGKRLIIGVSVVDSQMKQREIFQSVRKERDALARVMAIAEDYISIYSVDPRTGEYIQYNSTNGYQTLGLTKKGQDFFEDSIRAGQQVIYPEDLPMFMKRMNRDMILREIWADGVFKMHYRLMMNGEPRNVTLKVVSVGEGENERLMAGVRAWKNRG